LNRFCALATTAEDNSDVPPEKWTKGLLRLLPLPAVSDIADGGVDPRTIVIAFDISEQFAPCGIAIGVFAKGETDRAGTELAEARELDGGNLFTSIARVKAGWGWGVTKISASFEATYFAGLRSAKGQSAFANFPGAAYFGYSRYRGHAYTSRRGGRHGSAFLLLRIEPLHRAGLGHGLSRLWRAALRGGFVVLAVKTQIYLRPSSARPAIR
jgi:hypothetical protein